MLRFWRTVAPNPAVLVETGETFEVLSVRRASEARRSCGGSSCALAVVSLGSGVPSMNGATRAAEITSSNPLSSTRKSARTRVISYATE
jgi:hypothetical protein